MQMDENKALVKWFFEELSAGHYDEAFAKVADDVDWWVPGELPFSGHKNKAQYMGVVRAIQGGFPSGFTLTVTSMIAEGKKVAAEVASAGVHKNGRTYANKYHFLFEIEGGVVRSVKEYMDTLHLANLIKP